MLIFLRFADAKFQKARASIEAKASARRKIGPSDYQAQGVIYLTETARFEHLLDLPAAAGLGKAVNDITQVTQAVLEQIKEDPYFAEQVAERLRGKRASFAVPSAELIAGEESHEVEFKSTARWNLREGCKDKRMEDAIVKTVAGFLSTDGGTLLIGVNDRREPIGLAHDTATVKPPNADGLLRAGSGSVRQGCDAADDRPAPGIEQQAPQRLSHKQGGALTRQRRVLHAAGAHEMTSANAHVGLLGWGVSG